MKSKLFVSLLIFGLFTFGMFLRSNVNPKTRVMPQNIVSITEPQNAPVSSIQHSEDLIPSSQTDAAAQISISDIVDESLQHALGEDEVGRAAQLLLKRSLPRLSDSTLKPMQDDICVRQSNCPVHLSKFYAEALSRLSTKDFAKMKFLLQQNLVASDADLKTKVEVLAAEFTSEQFRTIAPTSARSADGHGKLGDDSVYLLSTQNNFLQLGASPRTGIGTSLRAISNSQDPIGRLLAGINLLHYYPNHSRQIIRELNMLGISNDQLRAAMPSPRLPSSTDPKGK